MKIKLLKKERVKRKWVNIWYAFTYQNPNKLPTIDNLTEFILKMQKEKGWEII